MVATKPFTCQSFRQNYFSGQLSERIGGGGGGGDSLLICQLPVHKHYHHSLVVRFLYPYQHHQGVPPFRLYHALSQADSTPPPLPPFLGGKNLPPPLLEVSRAPPLVQFYSNVISRRIYSALTTTTERTYFSTTPLPEFSIPPPPAPLPWCWNPPSPPPPSLMEVSTPPQASPAPP